ncbi:ABC transporter ATP-binding protein [Christensenellaceae bacterium NSJ-63]|uniref:ABC transporter ATP-binding protein n=1 Tax=Guopingia tenuis TaxID=2763656 RepID=A0A926DI68_9FIRM|nr:ABC transporter ATP-binding protein [Guopingia tenuis]MBC8538224.1 ABC transporter ATP-binding protein [Guopingia tenuis]
MLKRFWPYFSKYKKYLIISCLCVVLECMFELIIPLLMADIIDVGVATRDSHYIIVKGVEMIACALIALAMGAIHARCNALAGQGFGAELRKAEFEKLQSFSFSNMDHFSTSSLVTRLTSDITVLQNALGNGIRPMIRGPVMMVTALIMAVILNPSLAIVFLVALPALGICLFLILRRLRPSYGKMQRALDHVNSVVQENLTAIRVVKSYVREGYEKEKFAKVNQEFQKTSGHAFHLAVLNMPCFQLVMYATIIALLWFGGNMVMIGGMQVGKLTGFLSYVLQILNSLMMISNVFMLLTRSMTSAGRILEVMDESPDICDIPGSTLEVQKGDIVFSHVYFKYAPSAKEYVLSDISLHFPAGKVIGIVGGTGAAKSSLVQLIPRLYDISEGSLTIDGHPVNEYPVAHLRDAVGMVLQNNTLFSGTVRENLLWGNEHASEEELAWACHISCADEFINRLPRGLDTDLGQGGVNVSGGQKQRLCIARALLKRPKVLIFDDSTSAVDTATAARIFEGLKESLPDATKIIIAQRVSSIEHADEIVVMENGRVDAVGTHEELFESNGIYQDMVLSQKKGAEL